MNPWFVQPAWQNFSSMYRESVAASASKTEMERAHHLTAALYFGISALEAFINEQMREHLTPTKSQEGIFEVLRKAKLMDKVKKWPKDILGKTLPLDAKAIKLISDLVEVRHALTHPKTRGHDVYGQLDTIAPPVIVNTVAEYIVSYHEAAGTTYPYWVFGWNYLNPRPDSYEIMLFNDQQFMYSLRSLGLDVDPHRPDAARRHLASFDSYRELRDYLDNKERCEPKKAPFPYTPILCRQWWTPDHQQSCGCVSQAAIQRALDIDNEYAESAKPKGGRKGWIDSLKRRIFRL